MALGCVGFRFVSSIAEGVPAWSLKDELIALEQRQEKLEREIARGPEAQPLLHPNLAGLYRQKVAALEEALADPEEGAQAMEMIRLLIDALVLTPEDGKRLRDLEVAYLEQVEVLTRAATVLEAGNFNPARLPVQTVAARPDALGKLARVFLKMAQEVYEREQALRRRVATLRGGFMLIGVGLLWVA